MSSKLTLLLGTLALLAGCATNAPAPATPSNQAAQVSCGAPLPVHQSRASLTVEGFEGAGDHQLMISRAQPRKRCTSPAGAQGTAPAALGAQQ